MSYNNIGLTTPRGSGTSGYVQRNLSHTRRREEVLKKPNYEDRGIETRRKPDKSILEHEYKRQIENKCLQLELDLQDQQQEPPLSQDEIDNQVLALRSKLLADFQNHRHLLPPSLRSNLSKPTETHEMAALKLEENEKFRNAFNVNSNYEEGQAFDKEFQLNKKKQFQQDKINIKKNFENQLNNFSSSHQSKSQANDHNNNRNDDDHYHDNDHHHSSKNKSEKRKKPYQRPN